MSVRLKLLCELLCEFILENQSAESDISTLTHSPGSLTFLIVFGLLQLYGIVNSISIRTFTICFS